MRSSRLEWDASGSGFGERDHTFIARDDCQALAFKLVLRRAVPRVRVTIHGGWQ